MKMHNPARGSSSATHRSNGADRLDRRSRSKGVGRVYQQTVIDTYAKVAFAKLYDRKTPITAAEIPCRHKTYPGRRNSRAFALELAMRFLVELGLLALRVRFLPHKPSMLNPAVKSSFWRSLKRFHG